MPYIPHVIVLHLCIIYHFRFLYSKPLACSTGLGSGHADSHPESEGPFGKLGLPSPADWSAFLNVSHSKKERDLTQLALSDHEQRELYEAARQVQSTFRKYKVGPIRIQGHLCITAHVGCHGVPPFLVFIVAWFQSLWCIVWCCKVNPGYKPDLSGFWGVKVTRRFVFGFVLKRHCS